MRIERDVLLAILAAFALGLITGLLIPRLRANLRARFSEDSSGLDPIRGPLPDKKAEEAMKGLREGYLEEMAKFDRLVPWAAGGALLLSMTLVSDFSIGAPAKSALLIILAWILLVLALTLSIFGTYKATRIKVYAMEHLKALQNPPGSGASPAEGDKWKSKTREYQNRALNNQRIVSLTNWLAPSLLVGGFLLLVVFAIWAVWPSF